MLYLCVSAHKNIHVCERERLKRKPSYIPTSITSGDYPGKQLTMEEVIWWMIENERGALWYLEDEREERTEIYI